MDKLPNLDPSVFNLTLEQQFQMRQVEEGAKVMSIEQARQLLLEATRLVMIKDNVSTPD